MTRPHHHAGFGGLLGLFLRRNLTPGVLLLTTGLALIAATRDWSPGAAVAAVVDAPDVADAYRRQAVWGTVFLVALPILLTRAAGTARRWRQRDADWLGPLPFALFNYTQAALVGAWAGALVVVAITTVITESFTEDGGRGPMRGPMRVTGSVEHPAFSLVDGDATKSIVWRQPGLGRGELPSGSALILRPTVAPGSGPAVSIRATLSTPGETPQSIERRIFGRTRLVLPVPAGTGAITLSLERFGTGAVFVLPPRSMDMLVPARTPRSASYALALRLALTLLAWTSLAAGLGAWMRPSLASATCLALLVLRTASSTDPSLLPGSGLFDAWRVVGDGLVPMDLDYPAYLATAVAAALGALLLQVGLRRGRSAA